MPSFEIPETLSDEDMKVIDDGIADDCAQKGHPPYKQEYICVVKRGNNRKPFAALMGFMENGIFEITKLWVKSEKQSNGIGSELLKAAEEVVKARGGCSIVVWTYVFQAPGFYENHGFVKMGESPTNLKGGAKCYHYIKILPSGNDPA